MRNRQSYFDHKDTPIAVSSPKKQPSRLADNGELSSSWDAKISNWCIHANSMRLLLASTVSVRTEKCSPSFTDVCCPSHFLSGVC